MSDKYIIRAEIDATYDLPGMFAQDWFNCGIKRQIRGLSVRQRCTDGGARRPQH
jgi:hypothetical protein